MLQPEAGVTPAASSRHDPTARLLDFLSKSLSQVCIVQLRLLVTQLSSTVTLLITRRLSYSVQTNMCCGPSRCPYGWTLIDKLGCALHQVMALPNVQKSMVYWTMKAAAKVPDLPSSSKIDD